MHTSYLDSSDNAHLQGYSFNDILYESDIIMSQSNHSYHIPLRIANVYIYTLRGINYNLTN